MIAALLLTLLAAGCDPYTPPPVPVIAVVAI